MSVNNPNSLLSNPTVTNHFQSSQQNSPVRFLPQSAQPLLHNDLTHLLTSPPIGSQMNRAGYEPASTNFMAQLNPSNQIDHNQAMVNNFYNKHFNQNLKYNPFPSLATNYPSGKPPLPPSLHQQTPNSFNNLVRKEAINNSSPSMITATIPTNPATFIQPRDGTTLFNTLGLPVGIANGIKTTPELISNPSYMSSKFRKTKLW